MSETKVSALTPEVRADLVDKSRAIIARYPEGRSRSALLPMLHLVQSVEGYVSPAGMAFCAEMLGLTKAEVAAVATFYTMYKRRPTGEYLVSVCTNTMCGILGGQQAFDALREHLGVGDNETTSDGAITLEHAECLAACDYAPVLTVNYEFFDQVDAQKALDIVRELQAGERPQPDRGARLCSFKETSFHLAGFVDDREGAVSDGPAGEPTLAGLTLAAERGESVEFDPATPLPTVEPKGGKPAPAKAESKPPTTPKPAADGKPAGDTSPADAARVESAKDAKKLATDDGGAK